MIERFSISATGNLRFGEGTFTELAPLLLQRGFVRIAFVVSTTFSLTKLFADCLQTLDQVAVTVLPVSGEPSVDSVDAATQIVKEANCDVIVGIGGGSALDTAKAVAVMATHKEGLSVKRFLEGVGDMAPPAERLPLYAVPTTAGTGSEATKNAVISQIGSNGFKKSLRHDAYIPDMVIIDPSLALAVPFSVTAASGLDALTQLLEAYTSVRANPFIDALALPAIGLAGNALPGLLTDKRDSIELRADMAYAAYISGIAIANAGLGYVHGLAGPLGALHSVPHGLVCGSLITPINKAMLKRAESGSIYAEKMQRVAKLWHVGTLEGVIQHLENLNRLAKLPSLGSFGFSLHEIEEIGAKDLKRDAPVILDSKTVTHILQSLL